MKNILIIVTLLGATVLTMKPARAIEQPTYTVVDTREAYELRRYEPYIVAETRVIGSPMLACYDAPYMPWFLRRNEVLVEVDQASE